RRVLRAGDRNRAVEAAAAENTNAIHAHPRGPLRTYMTIKLIRCPLIELAYSRSGRAQNKAASRPIDPYSSSRLRRKSGAPSAGSPSCEEGPTPGGFCFTVGCRGCCLDELRLLRTAPAYRWLWAGRWSALPVLLVAAIVQIPSMPAGRAATPHLQFRSLARACPLWQGSPRNSTYS